MSWVMGLGGTAVVGLGSTYFLFQHVASRVDRQRTATTAAIRLRQTLGTIRLRLTLGVADKDLRENDNSTAIGNVLSPAF